MIGCSFPTCMVVKIDERCSLPVERSFRRIGLCVLKGGIGYRYLFARRIRMKVDRFLHMHYKNYLKIPQKDE